MKEERVKRSIITVAIIVLAALLAAPLFAKGNREAGDKKTEGKIVINYWSIEEPAQDIIEYCAEEYTKVHPNVEFKVNIQDDQGIKDTIQSALTTKDATLDWAWYLTGTFAKPLIDAGLLQDLTPYAKKYGWFDFLFPAYTNYMVDGGYYQLNFGMSICPLIYYNADLLKKNGLTPPQTMEELKATVKALKNLGHDSVIIGAQESWTLSNLVGQILVNSMGEEKYMKLIMHSVDKGFDKKVSWSDPDLIGGIEKVKELFENGIISENALATDYSGARSAFGAGDAAMLSDGSWGVSNITKEFPGFNFDCVVWPGWKKDVPFKMIATSANGLLIPKYVSKEKADIIADFWNFLLTKEMQLKGLQLGNFPVRKDITKEEMLKVAAPATASILANVNKYGSAEIFDMWLNSELHTAFMNALVAYLNGTGTLAQISTVAEAKAKEIMNR